MSVFYEMWYPITLTYSMTLEKSALVSQCYGMQTYPKIFMQENVVNVILVASNPEIHI